MPTYRGIGLMSGTSMDGVDVALLETDGDEQLVFGPTGSFPYSDADRGLLRGALAEAATLQDRTARPGVLAVAEKMVTDRHAEAVEAFLADYAIDPASISVVGFHGQTVLHRPKERLSVQLGDGAALAGRLGLDVVHDFRAADLAAGGEGAPIVPVFHRALVAAAGFRGPVALLNIGGVANVTYVEDGLEPIACDTGPGNALIDDLMLQRTGAPIDRHGRTAARGRVNEAALLRLLSHPFFEDTPPKSLDRNAFSPKAISHLSTEDAAATLTAFTAGSVLRLFPHLPREPELLIVCGGGARNPILVRELVLRLPCKVTTADVVGWSPDFLEAQAFAYLAARMLEGLPLTYPTTTGVPEPTPGGVIARASAATASL
ncbi:anhydro-N-acetylmuramic acid kinase [Methylocystis bryophila]|uniref:Anhydro-N-acetylmuramic acid kinase n=1 Tax=Methylocystis bryophila TaxID=655015 RepID=A0A1W6MQ56_9HYPH|nr:anhydro-N-acetylmuramic acid kinase [Methylocystis bryophila]ARN79724.1 anhydro-N-acetylmuramic acid kinase [Methylocystis bryophila]BDV39596.1 anhydro-N-acetylmuramic acid kinase [Methylocystis bryophila]